MRSNLKQGAVIFIHLFPSVFRVSTLTAQVLVESSLSNILFCPMLVLSEIVRCPICKSSLSEEGSCFRCCRCNTAYPCVDGIPDFTPQKLEDRILCHVSAWNNIGWDYDASIERIAAERLNAIDAPLLAHCGRGKRVLEIGCGTARLAESVQQRGGCYIGIDPSLPMLRQGVSRRKAILVRGVGEYLPFTENAFDTIIGGYCSFRYIQPDKLYRECARILKPGGVLAFTLWNHWALILHSLLGALRQREWNPPRIIQRRTNDVLLAPREIIRLKKFGFSVESLLSTRNVPLLRTLRFTREMFGWHGYWRGSLGSFFGYDLIFICRRSP